MSEILKYLTTFATEILPVILPGIIFFALRKNTSWKKFWLVLGLLLPAFVVFRSVQWLACKNDLEMAIEGLLFLVLYVSGALIGNFFKTSKTSAHNYKSSNSHIPAKIAQHNATNK